MGLAASQARLLTITARLADNELRSQTINNAKMRLATQSSQASDDYVSALNNAQLMFKNVDAFGNTQNQILNFNNLTSYSPYNTQYGLVNSAGMALVSEKEAALFKESDNNLETYLESHGLSWETTYFDNEVNGEIKDALTSFYDSSLSYLFSGKSNADFENLYQKYLSNDLSIEKANYNSMAQEYYYEMKNLYSSVAPEVKHDMIGEKTYAEVSAEFHDASLIPAQIIARIKSGYGSLLKGYDSYVKAKLTTEAQNYLENDYFPSLTNQNTLDGDPGAGFLGKKHDLTRNLNQSITYTDASGNSHTVTGAYDEYRFDEITIKKVNKEYDSSTGTVKTYSPPEWRITSSSSDKTYYYEDSTKPLPQTLTGSSYTYATIINKIKAKKNSEVGNPDKPTFAYNLKDGQVVEKKIYKQKADVYQEFVNQYLQYVLDTIGTLNPYSLGTLSNDFSNEYGFSPSKADLLLDFEALMKEPSQYAGSNLTFKNVIDAYTVDLMVDVLGEPKYTWIDKNDPSKTGNAEAKAQWYTNLFNRMSKGYKVLEDGLASSSKWLEYAFESGLVGLEQVDSVYNWNALSYNTCSNIYEESDASEAVAKAEAKYKRAMNDIQSKDSMYDMQLKNIDTEHSALQTEYDSIKQVITKNIERTMKFDQSG